MSTKHETYLRMSETLASDSTAKRLKVGCLIVKKGRIISDGVNGTHPGDDNNCEDENGSTKEGVLHAEYNSLSKLGKSTESSEGSIMYITHSPCLNCCNMIISFGITAVFYKHEYRCQKVIELLKSKNIYVKQIEY